MIACSFLSTAGLTSTKQGICFLGNNEIWQWGLIFGLKCPCALVASKLFSSNVHQARAIFNVELAHPKWRWLCWVSECGRVIDWVFPVI